VPKDWHLVHYGARAAAGGAGLVFTEMTCTSADARISPGLHGLVERDSGARRGGASWSSCIPKRRARICLQLGHAGRKGSNTAGMAGSGSSPGRGQLAAVGAPHRCPTWQASARCPRKMGAAADGLGKKRFLCARPSSAPLPASTCSNCTWPMAICWRVFLSPLTNVRDDEYGGSVQNRLRFPLEVLRAVRAAWPAAKPLSVRLSACDWAVGGLSESDVIVICQSAGGGGCGHSRHIQRPDGVAAKTRLRPYVADAVGRHGAEPRRDSNHCGGEYLRA